MNPTRRLPRPPRIKTVSKIYNNIVFKEDTFPKVEYEDISRYNIKKLIDQGGFGSVFSGTAHGRDAPVAFKLLNKSDLPVTQNEIKILKYLQWSKHILKLLAVTKEPTSKRAILVTELLSMPTVDDIKAFGIGRYIRGILRGLDFAHSRGIMHRDIKPNNVMMDARYRRVRIIDWGLATYYVAEKEYKTMMGTAGFMAPEHYLGMKTYDYSVDLWAVGCIMAGLFYKKERFFKSDENVHVFYNIVNVLGRQSLQAYMDKYHLAPPRVVKHMSRSFEGIGFRAVSSNLEAPANMMKKMLVFDHQERISASDALKDPIFDFSR